MAVDLQLPESYILQPSSADSNEIQLPTFELIPMGNNQPHLQRIICSVTGSPDWLVQQIGEQYRDFDPKDKLLKLSSPKRVKSRSLELRNPLPPDANCQLEVSVDYFDSTLIGGKPKLEAPKNVTKTCLFSASGDADDMNTVDADVETIKQQTPEKTAVVDAMSTKDNQSTVVDLNPERSEGDPFPGWLAIDFGTSNSTVTLFNPKMVPSLINALPQEQEKKLRARLVEWLEQPASEALPGVEEFEWTRFTNELYRALNTSPSRSLTYVLGDGDGLELLEALRYIDLSPFSSDRARKVARKRLKEIYYETFHEPPLHWQSMMPMELDPDRRATEIPSEIQVTALEPITVDMRPQLQRVWMGALTGATTAEEREAVRSQFYHSPKRYFGQEEREFPVSLNGNEQNVSASQLIQAAWKCLINLTEKSRQRDPKNYASGYFNTVVVTYPTIAPPNVRNQIEKLLQELGIQDVRIAYDEAVSAAIFFLWRELGGDLNLGIESFKIRCRNRQPHYSQWSQNVLVLDIGGGTTDIALMNLTLKDESASAFEFNEDRGDGGRYYQLTPKVLGSSGHLQLGGELMTLHLFQYLKVAIADVLLSALSQGYVQSTYLENRLDELQLQDDEYRPGSLLEGIAQQTSHKRAFAEALDTAERILPTRWKYNTQRLTSFYVLWEHAERAKIALGQKPNSFFTLSESEIESLLAETAEIDCQINTPGHLSVTLTSEQFEPLVLPVIQEAVKIAKGLMESRMKKLQAAVSSKKLADSSDSHSNALHTAEAPRLDWLILSGKTCNLYLVQQEVEREFSQSDYFVWNSERVTFVPEYAKLATSAGACYAEKLRRLSYEPKGARELLRKGADQLYIDVKNLFYFLPCSFILGTQDKVNKELSPLFDTGQELHPLDASDELAKARTADWRRNQLASYVYRQDFEDTEPQLWGFFDGQNLANELKMTEYEYRNHIRSKFEVDSRLNLSILLCYEQAYYLIDEQRPSCYVKNASHDSGQIKLETVFDNDHQLICDIAVGVLEGATIQKPGVEDIIFAAGQDYRQDQVVFHCVNGTAEERQIRGLTSRPLPAFPAIGKHTFYCRLPNSQDWLFIGELDKPDGVTLYNDDDIWKYYATLDEEGRIQIYAGSIPYWTSTKDPNCLKQKGCVFKTKLSRQQPDTDDHRDPFSGVH